MKTKLFISFFALILFASIAFAQTTHEVYDGYNSKEMQYFQNGGILYVVTTGDKSFDDSLIAAVQHYWKVSPFKVISKDDMGPILADKTSFYLATYSSSKYEVDFESPDKSKTTQDLVIACGKKVNSAHILAQGSLVFGDWYKVENMKLAGLIPISCGASYCVSVLDQEIEIIISKKIEKVQFGQRPFPDVCDEINKNAKEIKNRTLLINETWKSMVLKEKRMSDYKYSYKYVNEDELLSLMASDPTKYCFMGSSAGSCIEIFDPATKKFLFCEYLKTGMAIVDKNDIEKLNDAINGKPTK